MRNEPSLRKNCSKLMSCALEANENVIANRKTKVFFIFIGIVLSSICSKLNQSIHLTRNHLTMTIDYDHDHLNVEHELDGFSLGK